MHQHTQLQLLNLFFFKYNLLQEILSKETIKLKMDNEMFGTTS